MGTLRILGLSLLLISALVAPSEATTFWTETFEGHLNNSNGGFASHDQTQWATDACFAGIPNIGWGGSAPWIDGCNPMITTTLPNNGLKSLQSNFPPGCGDVETGQPNPECGRDYDRYFPPSDEVWVRYYRYTTVWPGSGDTEFHYNTLAPHKEFFINADFNNEVIPVVNLHNSLPRELGLFSYLGGPAMGPCPETGNFDPQCNWPANVAHIPLQDGLWYCLEWHVVASNPVGSQTGSYEAFVNGTQVIGYYNRITRQDPANQWDFIRLYAQLGRGIRFQDDLVVGNTRAGCGAAPPNLPGTPTNLTITQRLQRHLYRLLAWWTGAPVMGA